MSDSKPHAAFSVLRRLAAPKRTEPSYPALPEVGAMGETNVPGIYAAGELAGTPLVKLGLNAGHDLIDRLAPELQATAGEDDGDQLDLVIVGSGSAGFAATLRAHELGLSYLTLEAASFANTFVTMTKGKLLLAEPHQVNNRSAAWFEECTREDLVERWRTTVRERGLRIHEHEKVVDVTGRIDDFLVTTDVGRYRARRVVLCLGKAGNPRKLGVPGEKAHAGKIHHRLLDPDDFHGQDVLIVGAGDVACEAAIALARDPGNRVTMSAIDDELTFPRKRNVDAVRELEAAGKLEILLASQVRAIDDDEVTIELQGGEHRKIRNRVVFEMIGAELPLGFLKRVGIRLAGSWHAKRWVALALIFLGVYSLYALKSYGKGLVAWPFEALIAPATYDAVLGKIFAVAFTPFARLFSAEALGDIGADRGYQQGYLYSLLYTMVMLVFGYQALVRWRAKAKNNRYQSWRFTSLLGFQVAFFLLVNLVAVEALTVKYAWRAWGLYQPFPLFFNTFFWWYPEDPRAVMWFFVGAGALATLVGIPILARSQGKRFCTWTCGCGGLAETLGDRWRHLSPKGERSRDWEFQAFLVLLASILVAVVVIGMYRTDGGNPWWRSYTYLVDFWLVAVIPVALYPFFGGKVWCRYWCPLAAYNQLLAKWYGRLKIVADDKCITCTECSKYCQVGVDVMAFAKDQQPFDNSNSGCIQCGICIDVCPMDVLSFETSAGKATDLVAAQ
ncbi:MAG: NAD(P)-binding domain-containing protein [bacterium]|nr:NAD(P)-binding domain-containing protein [bacterium]